MIALLATVKTPCQSTFPFYSTGAAEQVPDKGIITNICKTMNAKEKIWLSFKILCIIMLPLNNSALISHGITLQKKTTSLQETVEW